MKKIIFSLLLLSIITILVLPALPAGRSAGVFAVGSLEAGASARLSSRTNMLDDDISIADERLLKLAAFLREKDSPLLPWANAFIEFADDYNIDWRLLPAISGIESSFGRHLINGSFNAYGWDGGYYYFTDWPRSIQLMSRFLLEKYYDRGLDTPQKIGSVYAPPALNWGARVSLIMKQIDWASLSPQLEI